MLAAHILTFTWYQSRAQRKASLLCYLDFDIDALCKTQCGTNGATLSCNILQTISMDRTIVNSEVSIVWPNLANTSPTSPPPRSLVCLWDVVETRPTWHCWHRHAQTHSKWSWLVRNSYRVNYEILRFYDGIWPTTCTSLQWRATDAAQNQFVRRPNFRNTYLRKRTPSNDWLQCTSHSPTLKCLTGDGDKTSHLRTCIISGRYYEI